MQNVVVELATSDPNEPEWYGDSGCRLDSLRLCPMILRHTKRENQPHHEISLFADHPDHGSQALINVYPAVAGLGRYGTDLQFYKQQLQAFKLFPKQVFSTAFLAPAGAQAFSVHGAFQTRDGRSRRRVVHFLEGNSRHLLIVYSRDAPDFAESPFFQYLASHLHVDDVKITFGEA